MKHRHIQNIRSSVKRILRKRGVDLKRVRFVKEKHSVPWHFCIVQDTPLGPYADLVGPTAIDRRMSVKNAATAIADFVS